MGCLSEEQKLTPDQIFEVINNTYMDWDKAHYFANTSDTWVTGKGLLETIQKLRDNCSPKSQYFNLWIIPLNKSENYQISWYVLLYS